jgi:PAS domain S-box-containing protein
MFKYKLEDFLMVKKPTCEELEQRVKELEDALTLCKRLNEEVLFFKAIVDCSSEAIAVRDSTERLIYINPAHEKLFGRSLDEARNLNYRDYYPPESVEVLNREVAPALERGESWEGVLDAFDANGRRFPLWERADTIRNAYGEIQYCLGLMHDISKEKRAEKAVDESEARFRELTELLPESIYEMDLKGNLIFANRSGFDHFGYTQEDFDRGVNAFNLIVPEDRDRGLENVQKILKGEKIGLTEYTALRKDGSTFPAMFRSAVIFHEGIPVGIRGFVIDITDRKRAEEALRKAHDELEQRVRERTTELERANEQMELEINERKIFEKALRESEERYRILVENSPDIISSVSIEDGRISSLNPVFEKITGWSRAEWIGKPYTSIIHPDDIPIAEEKYQQLLNGESLPPFELCVLTKSGEVLFGEFIMRPEIRSGEMVGFLGFARDITERKRTEEALRESEAKYQEIASNIPGVVYQFLLKKDGSYESPYISEGASSILGISAKEVIGNAYSLLDMIAKDDLERINQSIAESAQTMETWLQEFRIKLKKSGEIRWIRATSSPHLLPNGEILWNGVLFDISDRVRAEEALQTAHNELEKRVEERTIELAKANDKLWKEVKERKRADRALRKRESDLEAKSNDLAEVNAALKVLLKQVRDDKEELKENILSNVKQLVLPYLERLKVSRMNKDQGSLVRILELNLKNIVSPFAGKLSSKFLNLSPMEIRVANLVKEGKTNKEISELLCLSENTISSHRYKLRSKLDLKKKGVNLRSYLLSLNE